MDKTKKSFIQISIIVLVVLLTGCNQFGAKCSCGDPVEVKKESSGLVHEYR